MKKLYKSILSFSLVLTSALGYAQAPRTVLLEVSESNQVTSSAEAVCLKEEVKSTHGDDVAVISYHIDEFINGGDPFFNTTAEQWADVFSISQFGRGAIDRISYNGTSLTSLDPTLWSDTIAERLNRTSIARVTLPEVLVDPNTDKIYVRIQINFEKENIELKDFRFFCYVVQDNRVADQMIDTNATLCSMYPDTSDTAYDIQHMDVAIANLSTYEGTDLIIPNQVEEGAQYTTSYTYSIPNGVSVDDLRVIGFVSDYNATDITLNAVINTAKSSDFTEYDSSDDTDPNHPDNPENPNSQYNSANFPSGLQHAQNEDVNPIFYPNPVTEVGVLEFNVSGNQLVKAQVYNITGQLVKDVYTQRLSTGRHKAAFATTNLESGVYFMRVKGESFEVNERFVIK